MVRRVLFIVSLSVLGAGLASCDSTATHEDHEFERNQFILLNVLRTGQWDHLGACRRAATEGVGCAADAFFGSSDAYLAVLEALLENRPGSADAETICVTYNEAELLENLGASARACYFRCEEIYWIGGRNGGQCTFTNYVDYAANAAGEIGTCLEQCLRADDTTFLF